MYIVDPEGAVWSVYTFCYFTKYFVSQMHKKPNLVNKIIIIIILNNKKMNSVQNFQTCNVVTFLILKELSCFFVVVFLSCNLLFEVSEHLP